MAKRQAAEPMPEVTIGTERPFYSVIIGDDVMVELALGVVPSELQAEALKLLRWKARLTPERKAW